MWGLDMSRVVGYVKRGSTPYQMTYPMTRVMLSNPYLTEWQADPCENIIFPQLLLWTVNIWSIKIVLISHYKLPQDYIWKEILCNLRFEHYELF